MTTGTKTDPYTSLGVERAATKDQIRKAYYELAKQHHPDVGGEVNAFLPVRLAYETLIDDKKRAFFDSFGVMPNSSEANEISVACQGLRELFLKLLSQTSPDGLKRLDVVGSLRGTLEAERAKNQRNLKTLEQHEKELGAVAEILSAKLKVSDPGQPNLFQQALQTAIDQCAAQRQAVNVSLGVQKRALEILSSFTFDFDKAAPLTFGGTYFSTTSTAIGGW